MVVLSSDNQKTFEFLIENKAQEFFQLGPNVARTQRAAGAYCVSWLTQRQTRHRWNSTGSSKCISSCYWCLMTAATTKMNSPHLTLQKHISVFSDCLFLTTLSWDVTQTLVGCSQRPCAPIYAAHYGKNNGWVAVRKSANVRTKADACRNIIFCHKSDGRTCFR